MRPGPHAGQWRLSTGAAANATCNQNSLFGPVAGNSVLLQSDGMLQMCRLAIVLCHHVTEPNAEMLQRQQTSFRQHAHRSIVWLMNDDEGAHTGE